MIKKSKYCKLAPHIFEEAPDNDLCINESAILGLPSQWQNSVGSLLVLNFDDCHVSLQNNDKIIFELDSGLRKTYDHYCELNTINLIVFADDLSGNVNSAYAVQILKFFGDQMMMIGTDSFKQWLDKRKIYYWYVKSDADECDYYLSDLKYLQRKGETKEYKDVKHGR